VWPDDPSECSDQDFDGVGDNADAFPLSAYEWIDSDGDGLGDNADLFPNDARAKYDADNDGVANALDTFPNSPSLDSWFDVVFRIVAVAGLVAGAVLVWNKRQSAPSEEKWNGFETAEAVEFEATTMESANRPQAPPPADAFGFHNQP
jgi:hypothetical protein